MRIGLTITFILLLGVFTSTIQAQAVRKVLITERCSSVPNVDADLTDPCWTDARVATGFYQIMPNNGDPATYQSEVKIIYDNDAVYVGAMMYDPEPDKIFTELSPRDHIRIADYFGVYFDPFNDGQNAYGFFVTAAGVQVDMKADADGEEDPSWDAVWKSKVAITDSGWIAEFKIPYSALRFPTDNGRTWGLNFFRNIMRLRENTSWNLIDVEIEGILSQQGELKGIKDIKPPLRLSLFPYTSAYVENYAETDNWSYFMNYGMDLKYGINESFTLDVTLIPDFGQVQSDDQFVNFSPFEIYYEERRPFFTEGTELFNKNGVFYSRRVGSKPDGYYDIYNDYDPEDVIDNPAETQMINATKLSGKTAGGLGIGVFNAMTSAMHATVKDSLDNEKSILTEPFTNYNMFVFDQALKNNSFISVYNTNVYRGGHDYTANVTGLDGRFRDKKNKFGIQGFLNISQKYFKEAKPDFGFMYELSAGKVSGKFRYYYSQRLESDNYDPNDMGFLRSNNEFSNELGLSYHIFDPVGKILNSYTGIEMKYVSLYDPRNFVEFEMEVDNRTTFTNYMTVGAGFDVSPVQGHDYFEPRVDGWYYNIPANYSGYIFISPDYRKRFVIDLRAGIWAVSKYSQNMKWMRVSPRFRVNDRLNFRHQFVLRKHSHDIGYVTDSIHDDHEVIIFGSRDIKTITNTLESSYMFSNKSSLTFRLRHYWLIAEYLNYYDLTRSGEITPSTYSDNNDFIFNALNIDMVFTWNFAPGSEMLIVWKNAIEFGDDNNVVNNYFDNLRNTLDSPASNSFSIKLMYYLDYQYLKKRKQ